jgi:beta-glucanase (GH16 family)
MCDRWGWVVAAAAVALSGAYAVLGVTAAGVMATGADPGPDVPTETLVFADEFDRGGLDPSRWTTCYWWDDLGCTNAGNDELEWYLPDNVSVTDGVLRLEARRGTVRGSNGRTYPYTSGMVTTGRSEDDHTQQPRFGFRYGRLEVRMRMPEGKGLWPALWLLPLSHESRPEIDVMEVLGDTPRTLRAHVHYVDEHGERASRGHSWEGEDTSAGWHQYGLRWTPDELVWLVDGTEQWVFDEPAGVPREPMYLLINLAVGGEWPGDPAPSTRFPAAVEVDYVRIWQQGG